MQFVRNSSKSETGFQQRTSYHKSAESHRKPSLYNVIQSAYQHGVGIGGEQSRPSTAAPVHQSCSSRASIERTPLMPWNNAALVAGGDFAVQPNTPARHGHSSHTPRPDDPQNSRKLQKSKLSEQLEQYCRDHGFGIPQYELSIVQHKDGIGRDVPCFNYKVTIPALVNNYGSFQWTKLWSSEAEARESAAQFVFIQLGILPSM